MKRAIYFEIKVYLTTFQKKKISYVIFFVGYFFFVKDKFICAC